MSASAFWWNVFGLFLVLTWILQRPPWRGPGLVLAVALAAILSLTPFFGHVPRYWLSGLTPNVSVPLFVLLLASLVERAGGPAVFRRREWHAAWVFGATSALVLYPSALGLGLPWFDSYALGWPWLDWKMSLVLFGAVALTAAVLLWRGNRFGWIPALASAAYLARLQESHNFWDYLVDPLYAAASLLAATRMVAQRLLRR